jgi:solute carrier family 27 (fatty acid transporter), member 1/4
MELYSNRVANYFLTKLNLKKGDCVALFMENQPEHPGIWLGLSKIGVITALVNTNLKNEPLLHSINVAKAKYVIYGSSLTNSIKTIENKLSKDVGLIVNLNENETAQSDNQLILNSALKTTSDKSVKINEKINHNGIKLLVKIIIKLQN